VRIDSAYLRVLQAWRCDALEDRLSPLSAVDGGVGIELEPFEVATIRMKTEPMRANE
jgi:hypothetical protein